MTDPIITLSDIVGESLPPGIAALPAASQCDLAELVTAAVATQTQSLSAAATSALDQLPPLLRWPLLRLLSAQ